MAMNKNFFSVAIALPVVLGFGLACSNHGDNSTSNAKPANASKPSPESTKQSGTASAKLDSYTIKGIKFAYFKIPAGLKENELIDAAQKLHEQEPDTQLILVDDDSELKDYISYVKAISGQGEIDKPMPAEWADKHIIANVQKYMNGKFVLCKGNGSSEIADLK